VISNITADILLFTWSLRLCCWRHPCYRENSGW